MDENFANEERNLSSAETLVMKAVWDVAEDISVPDLMENLKVKYARDYARTTVATFLLKLSEKGFVRVYRKGKLSYVHALKREADYRTKLLQDEVDFWYHGNRMELLASLFREEKMTESDKMKIWRVLDGMDD